MPGLAPVPAGGVQEVLARMDFGPAFPGFLIGPGPHDEVCARRGAGQRLLVGRNVARWIGVLFEAEYGAQVFFTWHEGVACLPVLAVHDDPWGDCPGTQPELVRPDERGRYAIAGRWSALADRQSADWTAAHETELALLKVAEPGPDAPDALRDYLALGQTERPHDPTRFADRLRSVLDDCATTGHAEPIVDVIADPSPSSGTVMAFVNGFPADAVMRTSADLHSPDVARPGGDPVVEVLADHWPPEPGTAIPVVVQGVRMLTDRWVLLGDDVRSRSAKWLAVVSALDKAQEALTPPAAARVLDIVGPVPPWSEPPF